MTGLVDQFEGREFAGTAQERSMVLAYEKQAAALRVKGTVAPSMGADNPLSKRAARRKAKEEREKAGKAGGAAAPPKKE